MSIAIDEAKKNFSLPDNYGAPAFNLYWLRDQQQQAYVAGRTAEPTRAEAIAVAKMGIEQDNREGYGWEAWDLIPEDNKELLIEDGLEMLNAARKVVAE